MPGSSITVTRRASTPSPCRTPTNRSAVLDGLRHERELARLDPRDQQEVLDEPDQPVGLQVDDRQVLLHLLGRELVVTSPERVHEAADGGEGRAELVARDRDEVGLQLVQLAEPDEHLLLAGAQAGGLDDQRDLVGEATQMQQPLAIDRARLVARSWRIPITTSPARSGTTASAGSAAGSAARGPGPMRTARPGDEARAAMVAWIAVDTGRDQDCSAVFAGLEQQHPERSHPAPGPPPQRSPGCPQRDPRRPRLPGSPCGTQKVAASPQPRAERLLRPLRRLFGLAVRSFAAIGFPA